MTNIPAVSSADTIKKNQSAYSAVKIQVNNPKANIPADRKIGMDDSEFNAVNIEVNEPELNSKKKHPFGYPESKELVTFDQTGYAPIEVPELPIPPMAYKASVINRSTVLYSMPEDENKPNIVESVEFVEVPEPNLTTTEAEKNLNNDDSFNGVSFHASPKTETEETEDTEEKNDVSFKAAQKPNIKADAGIKPSVEINKVISNLSSEDFDKQASQMEEIVSAALDGKAIPYVTSSVFSGLIDIVNKDSKSLEGPSEEQLNIRKKFIVNELMKQKQISEGKKTEEIEIPYQITEKEMNIAKELSPMEMAERNKEYALFTLAGLAKTYSEEYEKKTGNVVPLTDLPGASTIVDTLRKSDNPTLRTTAIETLIYIKKPEYKDELKSILSIAVQDENPMVAQTAAAGLEALEK